MTNPAATKTTVTKRFKFTHKAMNHSLHLVKLLSVLLVKIRANIIVTYKPNVCYKIFSYFTLRVKIMKENPLALLVSEIKKCTLCQQHLPLGPRPVLQISRHAKIIIAGQAPGVKVHNTGIPFDDASGDRLRQWMGITKATFYDAQKIAILPMGFCYPGTGKSGDLPPRSECALAWRKQLLSAISDIKLILVIGAYAQNWHMKETKQKNLTETVRNWENYGPQLLPLPHPSPRNNIWLSKNPWFEQDLLPQLKNRVKELL